MGIRRLILMISKSLGARSYTNKRTHVDRPYPGPASDIQNSMRILPNRRKV
jgi:hypothetical protein